jgi:hypothetical protein
VPRCAPQSPDPEIYIPFLQCPVFSKHLIVRAAANPAPLLDALRGELRAVDPTVSIEQVKTLERVRTQSISGQLFAMRLLVGTILLDLGRRGEVNTSPKLAVAGLTRRSYEAEEAE